MSLKQGLSRLFNRETILAAALTILNAAFTVAALPTPRVIVPFTLAIFSAMAWKQAADWRNNPA